MKVHLGCGKVHMDGYVNVDIDGNPDLKADIMNLPFEDNSIEEIISIATFEHFYRWDAIDLLKDFYRMLIKPGGVLILETPDLMKMAEIFSKTGRFGWKLLTTPVGRISKAWQAFYGDQYSKNVYQTHKYVWTNSELEEEMVKAGFSVTNEIAQYHVPARDMRVVGVIL